MLLLLLTAIAQEKLACKLGLQYCKTCCIELGGLAGPSLCAASKLGEAIGGYMAIRATDNEKAIAIAFLRSGHPWLAFATVAVKSGTRVAIVVVLVGGGLAVGQSTSLAFMKALPNIIAQTTQHYLEK
jgi:hypothetical protein